MVTAFLDLVRRGQPDGLGDVHGPSERVAGRMVYVVRFPGVANNRATGRVALVVAPVQPRRRRASGGIEDDIAGPARLVHDGVPHIVAIGPDPASKHAALSPAISRLIFLSLFFEFVVVVPYLGDAIYASRPDIVCLFVPAQQINTESRISQTPKNPWTSKRQLTR